MDWRTLLAFDGLTRDLRHALRRILRDRGFTAAAILILGVAIGANTAIFSVINAVLFREQAFAQPERLVNIYQNDRAGRPLVVTTYAAYERIGEYSDVFAATMAATLPNSTRYLLEGAVRDGIVEHATASYLDTLGLRPALGRWFDETEARPGAPLVAVLGHQTWSRVFRADPSVIGRVLNLEGTAATIIGIAPVGYRGTVDVGLGTDFWLPITALPATGVGGEAPTIRAPLLVKARLRDAVTVAQARAAMDVLGRRLTDEFPDEFRREGELALGAGITVIPSPEVRVHPQADTVATALASVVLVIVGLVLAIASSNLATLLLVRGAARVKEISIRLAMGADRSQLLRHLLMESLLLALAGGVAGCLLAWWGINALQALELPFRVDVSLDYRVLAFALALSLVTGVAFGLAPALNATRVDLVSSLRDQGLQALDRRRFTLKNVLIVFQVAISVLLLGGTSIFLQTAAAARALHVGYAVDGVAMLETDARFGGYSETRARAIYDDLLRRIESIPGVESAALLRGAPMQASSMVIVLDAAAGNGSTVEAAAIAAGPAFFDTLRIRLLHGRLFDTRDGVGTPRAAVITERMAREHFGGPNAVGRRFRSANDQDSWTEVIGVVADTGTGSLADDVLDPIAPVFYRSYTQATALPTTVVARTSADATALVAAMQRELRAVDAALPVIMARTMAQQLDGARTAPTAAATLLGVLGGLGLLLASIGLYAIVAFAVTKRTREIGIRMALGARSGQVVWSTARGVAGLIAVGTGVGLVLSLLAMLALRAASGDIGIGTIAVYKPHFEPLAFLTIAAVTAFVGVAAVLVPGRRAALMDPTAALRHD